MVRSHAPSRHTLTVLSSRTGDDAAAGAAATLVTTSACSKHTRRIACSAAGAASRNARQVRLTPLMLRTRQSCDSTRLRTSVGSAVIATARSPSRLVGAGAGAAAGVAAISSSRRGRVRSRISRRRARRARAPAAGRRILRRSCSPRSSATLRAPFGRRQELGRGRENTEISRHFLSPRRSLLLARVRDSAPLRPARARQLGAAARGGAGGEARAAALGRLLHAAAVGARGDAAAVRLPARRPRRGRGGARRPRRAIPAAARRAGGRGAGVREASRRPRDRHRLLAAARAARPGRRRWRRRCRRRR